MDATRESHRRERMQCKKAVIDARIAEATMVIFGEATEQRPGIVAGAKYMAKLGKTTLEGNGEWTDPTTKDVATLTFLLRLAQ